MRKTREVDRTRRDDHALGHHLGLPFGHRSWATTQVAADDRARWGSPGIIIYFYRAGFILFSFERLLE